MQSSDYSFRKDFPTLSTSVPDCAEDNTITVAALSITFPNGISFTDFDLTDKQRIDASLVKTKIDALKASNRLPAANKDVDQQMTLDRTFFESVRREYCFYENRYRFAARRLLTLIMSDNESDVAESKSFNGKVVELNKRLMSLLELMNAVANERARRVDVRREDHTTGNDVINNNLDKLAAMRKWLKTNNMKLSTQKEMQRYTEEKNRALRVQITVFAVLNVVALGAVFAAYKQSL